jgi:hypothetical protein
MGLLDNTTQQAATGLGGGGHYKFMTLDNIINAFMIVHVGEDKILPKVNRTDVQFHAMRAIQELSYDVFRSVKKYEIVVPNTLVMPLPHDYVNYVKLSKVGNDGIEKLLYSTGKTSAPFPISQDANGDYQYTDGVLQSTGADSTTWSSYSTGPTSSDDGVDIIAGNTYEQFGRRYGLDPQHAQSNGSFFIDLPENFIHFGSALSGETVVLRYISDGLGTDAEMVVHKFCEEAVYKWIMCGILSSRSRIPEYIVQRFKKEKFAETRKAKIRLSNIKIEEFTQILKGLSKPIK